MARNGSGTFSVLNSFSSGNTISSSEMNSTLSDVGAEITNSVAVDGQSTLTGQLKGADGTNSAPGITFGADLNTGLYRIGADNLGVTVGGTKIIDIASTGIAVTGTLSATGALSGTTITGTGALSIGTSNAATVGTIELGAASDTTISRTGAGAIAVEGVTVALNSASLPHTASTIELGHATDTTLARVSAGVFSVEGSTVHTTATGAATQADHETGTSTSAYSTPGRQKYHPTHPKSWLYADLTSGTPTIAGGSGVSSLADINTGRFDINLTTAFSSVNYAMVLSGATSTASVERIVNEHTQADRTASKIEVRVTSLSGTLTDAVTVSTVGLGDQ